jgi:hypothetical protein
MNAGVQANYQRQQSKHFYDQPVLKPFVACIDQWDHYSNIQQIHNGKLASKKA